MISEMDTFKDMINHSLNFTIKILVFKSLFIFHLCFYEASLNHSFQNKPKTLGYYPPCFGLFINSCHMWQQFSKL